jgi:transposase-like protein
MKYREEYSQIVEDWRNSGLNRADYCVAHGYHPSTFDGWIKKTSRSTGQSKSAKCKVKGLKKQIQTQESVFVPLKIENAPQPPISPTFELRYPNGVSLSMNLLPATEDLSRIVHLYRSELCSR